MFATEGLYVIVFIDFFLSCCRFLSQNTNAYDYLVDVFYSPVIFHVLSVKT